MSGVPKPAETAAWLEPNWPPLAGVRSAFTVRTGGVSAKP